MNNGLQIIQTTFNKLRIICQIFVLVSAFSFGCLFNVSNAFAEIFIADNAEFIGDRTSTKLVMDFDSKPAYTIHYLPSPYRVIIDLPAVRFTFSSDELKASGLFNDVRFGTMGEGHARIVLTSPKPVQVKKSEIVQIDDGSKFRFVAEAEEISSDSFSELIKNQSWINAKKSKAEALELGSLPALSSNSQFVVVIDAGHGGIDVGAHGVKTGTPEKDITLAFSKMLHEKLNSVSGIKAIMTREDDVFLSLSERVVLAREEGANLFLSIHADTLRQKDIRGATVYTLSDKASDRMAEALAQRENLSDELAGIAVLNEQPIVADILMDLTRRETQVFSNVLAEQIINTITGKVTLINNAHRYAGFQVLRAHDVPSVLIELGFLSNEKDEELLLNDDWRLEVAGLIADAVASYKSNTVVDGR